MAKLKDHERLVFASMGKLFEITAWFHNDADANAYMYTHPDEGVIASTIDGLVLLANVRSAGVSYKRSS